MFIFSSRFIFCDLILKLIYFFSRHSRWGDVKKKFDSDPRYKSIESSSLKEDYFMDFVHDLKDDHRTKSKKDKKDRKRSRSRSPKGRSDRGGRSRSRSRDRRGRSRSKSPKEKSKKSKKDKRDRSRDRSRDRKDEDSSRKDKKKKKSDKVIFDRELTLKYPGRGRILPIGQEIACHFSQVTKILDFIHKHPI